MKPAHIQVMSAVLGFLLTCVALTIILNANWALLWAGLFFLVLGFGIDI